MSDESEARWRRRKEARPGEIVAAALECFRERGYATTRLEEIAARAGVTKGTIYLYFPSKEDLFKAVVLGELSPRVAELEATLVESELSSADLLAGLVSYWATEMVPAPVSVVPKLVISEAGNFPDLARFYLENIVHRGLRLIGGILRRGIDRGEFRTVDVDQVVYCVISPLLFMVLWRHSLGPHDDRPMDSEAVGRAHLDLLLHGLRRQAVPEPPKPPERTEP